MNAPTYCDIANAVSAIWVAPDPKACSRIFVKAIAAFKIDAFASGEIDLAALERTVFYSIGWPDAWHKFYVGGEVIRRDPVVAALKQSHGPFTWSELRRDKKLSAAGTKVVQAVAEYGWTEGLAVPIPRGDQRFGLVSLLCDRRAFDADEKSALAMLSYCFHERLRNLVSKHGFAAPPLGLTKREIDALRLIARGATDRDVAGKLGISPSTAHEHFEKAKRKLNVSTRAEAIAIAVSLAIVAP
jgi:LuxR family quorum sensing-dependent transcriptional regulator